MMTHWLQFLHQFVMADERNEVLLYRPYDIPDTLAIRISFRPERGEVLSYSKLYPIEVQSEPNIMKVAVMAQAKALNRKIREEGY